MDRETRSGVVRDALAHLRNRLYLGKHPLAVELGSAGFPLSGDALREVLLAQIEKLKPAGRSVSPDADWRRYRHLILRYEEGQSQEQVAHTLGVSVRQATRDHHQAVEALVELIWQGRSGQTVLPPDFENRDEPDGRTSGQYASELAEEIAQIARTGETFADLADTVEGVASTLDKLAQEKGISLRPFVADALPPVAMSRTLLRQAILNLVMYAIELASGGQVLLAGTDTARGVSLRVVVQSLDRHEASVRLGETSSPEVHEFAAAAQQILEAQGATIELGRGEPGQPLATVVLPPVPLRTLLVVDDNPELIGLFRRYLRDQPYRVIQATSGASALRLCHQLKPEVIILDVMMPSPDGWEIVQQLRSDAETRDLPVIMCSVLPERTLARSLGISEYLMKPFTRQSLLAALDRFSQIAAERQAPS